LIGFTLTALHSYDECLEDLIASLAVIKPGGWLLGDDYEWELTRGKPGVTKAVKEFVKPLIIRLLSYVKFKNRGVRLNRKRIYKRDNNQCVYCGSEKNLTIDHIIPRSRGGKNTWTNLITCCSSCNLKKANKTPEEANMKMRYRAYEPTVFSSIISSDVEILWSDFKESFV